VTIPEEKRGGRVKEKILIATYQGMVIVEFNA